MSTNSFNTNTLGYKLLSGKLRDNRKHSEQLNKYLAGLMDSDGCLSLRFSPDRKLGYYRTYLVMELGQSASVDPDFSLLRALRDFYNLGEVYMRNVESEMHKSSVAQWKLPHKESLILYNRISKHLRVKGTHWDNLVWLAKELELFTIKKESLDELKEFSKCSRQNSKWVNHPKHLSWAWVSGFLDGDGHYRYRVREQGVNKKTELYVTFNCSECDQFITDFFKVCFKGSVFKNSKGLYIWKRNLGKEAKCFAIDFLGKLRQYSCLEYKYLTMCKILEFHQDKQAAETNQYQDEESM